MSSDLENAAPPPASSPRNETPARPDHRFPWAFLFLLLAAAVALRVATSLSRVDEYYLEGLVRGRLTQSWIEDAPVWPGRAPQIPHLRGSVVVSAMAIPFFHLFGPTTFAIRVPGILFHLASLATFLWMVHQLFGRRAAMCAGAGFVLAVPSLAKIAVLSYGDHIESLPFLCATIALAAKYRSEGTGGRRSTAFLLGIVVGLGICWHAQSRLGVVAAMGGAILAYPSILLRGSLYRAFLPGAILGLIPLAVGDWFTARLGLAVMEVSATDVARELVARTAILKWCLLWIVDLPRSLQYTPQAIGSLVIATAIGSAVVLFLRRLRDGRAVVLHAVRRAAPILAYVFAFSLAYAGTRFDIAHGTDNAIEVRYILPVVPFVLLPIPLLIAAWWDSGRTRSAAALALGSGLVFAAGSLSTIDLASILHEPPRSAVPWHANADHFCYGSLDDTNKERLRRLEVSLYGSRTQEQVVNNWMADRADANGVIDLIERHDDNPARLRPLLYALQLNQIDLRFRNAAPPPHLRVFAFAQTGRSLGAVRDFDPETAARVLERCQDHRERRYFAAGLGVGFALGLDPRMGPEYAIETRLSRLPADIAPTDVAFGCGVLVGSRASAHYPGEKLLIEQFRTATEPSLWPAFARGLGAGYSARFLEPVARDLDAPSIRRILERVARGDPRLESEFRDGLVDPSLP